MHLNPTRLSALVTSFGPYLHGKVEFVCISVHKYLAAKVSIAVVSLFFTVFTNLHNILPSIKLRQSHGPHRFSGLSSQEPLLVSYLTNKVGFGIISANIWLPETVMY